MKQKTFEETLEPHIGYNQYGAHVVLVSDAIACFEEYHTQASKTAVSGEVKTAESFLREEHPPISKDGQYTFAEVAIILNEYAAQFEAKWQSIDSAPIGENKISVGAWVNGTWETATTPWNEDAITGPGFYGEVQATHWMPLPSPPKSI